MGHMGGRRGEWGWGDVTTRALWVIYYHYYLDWWVVTDEGLCAWYGPAQIKIVDQEWQNGVTAL